MKEAKKSIANLSGANAITEEIKGGHSPIYKNPTQNTLKKTTGKVNVLTGQIAMEDDAELNRYFEKFGRPE